MITRIREAYDETRDTNRAISLGLARTGKLITSGAGVLMFAFFALSTGPGPRHQAVRDRPRRGRDHRRDADPRCCSCRRRCSCSAAGTGGCPPGRRRCCAPTPSPLEPKGAAPAPTDRPLRRGGAGDRLQPVAGGGHRRTHSRRTRGRGCEGGRRTREGGEQRPSPAARGGREQDRAAYSLLAGRRFRGSRSLTARGITGSGVSHRVYTPSPANTRRLRPYPSSTPRWSGSRCLRISPDSRDAVTVKGVRSPKRHQRRKRCREPGSRGAELPAATESGRTSMGNSPERTDKRRLCGAVEHDW